MLEETAATPVAQPPARVASPLVLSSPSSSSSPPSTPGSSQGLIIRRGRITPQPAPTTNGRRPVAVKASSSGAKPRRRPGERALAEIRKYQRSTRRLLPEAPFSRLVRQITLGIRSELRWAGPAIKGLQEATEAFLVSILEDANACAIHSKRVTIMPRDISLTLRLRLKPCLADYRPL